MAEIKGMKIKKNHEDSPKFAEYYKKQYPDLTIEQCEEKAKWFRKSCNYKCIEYYEKNYPNLSHEEHLKLKEKLNIQQRQNRETNIEYWKLRYPEKSLEELEELRSKVAKSKNKQNLEYWINKYPEKSLEEVKELHKKYYQSWLSHQEGWGKGDKNCNSKKNSTQQERNARSPRNIEFYKRKYPELSLEEQEILRQEYIKKNNNIVKNTIKQTNIEYYLNQGMSEEDAKKALHDRQATFSLYKCIEKYGEEKGLEIFNNRQKIWNKKLQNKFKQGKYVQSPIANKLFSNIKDKLNIKENIKEKYIFNDELHKGYLFDFCLNNKLIEFNGDYWHANPKFYGPLSFIKAKNKKAKDIWEYDKIKIQTAEKQGYKVLIIWEYDYKNDKEKTLKKCMDFLIND